MSSNLKSKHRPAMKNDNNPSPERQTPPRNPIPAAALLCRCCLLKHLRTKPTKSKVKCEKGWRRNNPASTDTRRSRRRDKPRREKSDSRSLPPLLLLFTETFENENDENPRANANWDGGETNPRRPTLVAVAGVSKSAGESSVSPRVVLRRQRLDREGGGGRMNAEGATVPET